MRRFHSIWNYRVRPLTERAIGENAESARARKVTFALPGGSGGIEFIF
jgi:hypothetical protein